MLCPLPCLEYHPSALSATDPPGAGADFIKHPHVEESLFAADFEASKRELRLKTGKPLNKASNYGNRKNKWSIKTKPYLL